MKRIIMVALVAAILGGLVGILGFVWFVGGNGEPSEPVSAPTLDINAIATLNPTQAFAAVTQVAQLNAQVSSLQATIDALNAIGALPTTEVVTEEPQATPAAAAAETVNESAAQRILYRIDSSNSEVTFAMQEDLRGVRTDVVGTTNEVAGDIILDFTNPAASQIGTIRINARTLATDSEFRNRALRSEILQSASDEYEFIEFVPTAITGLPESVTMGETYNFEITGNLTIAAQTKEVSFTAAVTPESDTQLSGSAQATVLYADWGISIPNAPGVANVTEDVTLTIDFVAQQAEQ